MLRRFALFLGVLLFLALAGLGAWSAGRSLPPQVQVVHPRVSPLAASTTAQGRIESNLDATVRARVEGLVQTLNVDQGDPVREGAELLVFDTVDARNRVEQAQDRLALSDWEVKDAEREVRHSRSLVGVASESKAQLEANESRFERAQLQRTLAQKELALARAHLEKLSCPAPQSGVVIEKLVEAGQWVAAGQPLFKVADPHRLKVAINVDESDAPAVRIGQPCVVTADSLPGESFPARVTKISPAARVERDATVVVVTAELTDESGRLKIGNQVDVRVITRDQGQVLALPVEGVRSDAAGRFAWVVSAGTLRRQAIRPGVQNTDLAEILAGLSAADLVVVSLGLDLTEGERVTAVEKP